MGSGEPAARGRVGRLRCLLNDPPSRVACEFPEVIPTVEPVSDASDQPVGETGEEAEAEEETVEGLSARADWLTSQRDLEQVHKDPSLRVDPLSYSCCS